MRLRIKQAHPTSLNDAVRHAVELEAINRAEKNQNWKARVYLMQLQQAHLLKNRRLNKVRMNCNSLSQQ